MAVPGGKTALLIIDMQNDFCPPNGSLKVEGGLEVIAVINKIRKSHKFDVVALTQDFHPNKHSSFYSNNTEKDGACLFASVELESGPQVLWPDHCVQGTPGADFHNDLVREDSDIIVQKGLNVKVDSYSGFFDNNHAVKSDLDDKLKAAGVTTVFIGGLAYDYCVGYSALDAAELGYKAYVIEDATSGISEESIKQRVDEMKAKGVEIIKSSDIGKYLG